MATLWLVVWLLIVVGFVALSIWLIVRFGERRRLPSRRALPDDRDRADAADRPRR